MRTRTFVSMLVGTLAIASLLQLGIYAHDNIIISSADPAARQEQPGALTAFLVAKPNFVVDGANLGKVEIWAVPVGGSDRSESNYHLIGNATLQAGEDPLVQIWTLPVPATPVAATEIFAKGFDMNGDFVGQMSLPYLGATQVFNAVWGGVARNATSSNPAAAQRHFSFALKIGEKATAGGLSVELIGIDSDSRCPRAAVCIWAGEVAARVRLSSGNRDETVTLRSMSALSRFGDHKVGITGVSPARLSAPPAKEDYRVTFSVERL